MRMFHPLPSFALSRSLVLALWLVSMVTVSAQSATALTPDAESYIRSLSDQAMSILNDETLTQDGRRDAFRELVFENLNLEKMGNFVLGPYSRRLTDDVRGEYHELLKDYVASIYLAQLGEFSDQEFKIKKAIPKGRKGTEFIVQSEVVGPDSTAKPIAMNWWILHEDDHFSIFDVQVVGIWMAQEKKSTFVSVIQRNNGEVQALIDHLRKEVAETQKSDDNS